MRPENFDVEELVQDLTGTCQTIQHFLPEGMEESDLTEQDHEHIDSEIFNCHVCGWWCEQGESREQDGEDVCADCFEGEEED